MSSQTSFGARGKQPESGSTKPCHCQKSTSPVYPSIISGREITGLAPNIRFWELQKIAHCATAMKDMVQMQVLIEIQIAPNFIFPVFATADALRDT